MNYFLRERRYLTEINSVFLLLPLVLLPLLFEWWFHLQEKVFFTEYRDEILITNIIYMILVRFALLDSAIYIFSRSQRRVHIALMQVVLLYLIKNKSMVI